MTAKQMLSRAPAQPTKHTRIRGSGSSYEVASHSATFVTVPTVYLGCLIRLVRIHRFRRQTLKSSPFLISAAGNVNLVTRRSFSSSHCFHFIRNLWGNTKNLLFLGGLLKGATRGCMKEESSKGPDFTAEEGAPRMVRN